MLSITLNQEVELGNSTLGYKILDLLRQHAEEAKDVEVVIKGATEDQTFYGESMKIVNAKYPFRIVCEN